MPKVSINLQGGRPLFDIASYARRGPGRRDRLSPAEVALVSRTARRAPEVMVKVLTKGSTDYASVSKHFGYIGRYGRLALESDDGMQVQGRHLGRELIEDWDLDLQEHRRSRKLSATFGRPEPKLVHKLMLSMPAGTSPKAVLAAARSFLREEFALQHRYAFVLHTDEPHPHVHAVVKAVSERGERLHIKKDTLRRWRAEFARHLRAQGVEANATERALRGVSKTTKHDGIYRAAQRGNSSHMQVRVETLVDEMAKGNIRLEAGKAKLVQTRKDVLDGWRAMGDMLANEGRHDLAADVRRFVQQMQPARTEKEWMVAEILEQGRTVRVQDKAPPAR